MYDSKFHNANNRDFKYIHHHYIFMSAWMEYNRTRETPEYIAGFSVVTGGVDPNLETILDDMRGFVDFNVSESESEPTTHQGGDDSYSIVDHIEPSAPESTLDLSKYLKD